MKLEELLPPLPSEVTRGTGTGFAMRSMPFFLFNFDPATVYNVKHSIMAPIRTRRAIWLHEALRCRSASKVGQFAGDYRQWNKEARQFAKEEKALYKQYEERVQLYEKGRTTP